MSSKNFSTVRWLNSPVTVKIIHATVGFICLAVAFYYGSHDKSNAMWVGFLSFVLLLITANAGAFSEFTASLTGVRVRMRELKEATDEAKATIAELRKLALIVTRSSLGTIKASGRIGGYNADEGEAVMKQCIETLRELGASEKEIDDACDIWHQYVELDYRHLIFRGIDHRNLTERLKYTEEQWRCHPLEYRPTAARIREFLVEANLLDDTRSEWLEDLEYYQHNREHRRLATWCERMGMI